MGASSWTLLLELCVSSLRATRNWSQIPCMNICPIKMILILIIIVHSCQQWHDRWSSTVHIVVFSVVKIYSDIHKTPSHLQSLRDLKRKPCNFPWFNWVIYIWGIYILIRSSVPQQSHWLTLSLDDILWTHYERRDANDWHGPCSMNIRRSQLVSDTASEEQLAASVCLISHCSCAGTGNMLA